MNLTVDYSPPAYLFGHAALTDKSLNLIHGECQGFRIVDLGCGEGDLLKHLSGAQPLTYSIRCIGIDPSLPRTTADKSAGWMLTKSRWQDHEVGRLISSDTVVILSWPANTLDVEASASLISHLNHAAKVILIGQETDGVVVGDSVLWNHLARRDIIGVIRQAANHQFVAVYGRKSGLPCKRGLPLALRYQEERCGVTGRLEDWTA